MTTHLGGLAARLTRWFEARLDEMVPPRRSLARRYGLEVIDAEGIDRLDPAAVRVVFVCEAEDPTLVRAVSAQDDGFDATAVVEWSWVPAPLPEGASRPGRYPRRRRERLVTVTPARTSAQ